MLVPDVSLMQAQLPDEYYHASEAELAERAWRAKAQLGDRLVILGHHYQREEVIQFADETGDSYKLSLLAARRPEAQYIVFCGVHFMAETADILSRPEQAVVLPDLGAGCSMADMANLDQVDEAWSILTERYGPDIIPITYINSAAALKAFVGRNGGTVCTSSNAVSALQWALGQGRRVLFFPDQHLGRNTGAKLGIPVERMVVWDQYRGDVAGTDEQAEDPTVILWKGHCSVHQKFTPQQMDRLRSEHPDIQIIVHPECSLEVVQKADYDGSTEVIIKRVTESPPGSQWAVGTEINLVSRLARNNPDKLVLSLSGPNVCPCSTMYRISPQHLCWVLESLVRGQVVNRVQVDDETKHWSKIALERMLTIPVR